MRTALVTGAGGFIGGHLAGALAAEGTRVRAADRKPLSEWHQVHPGAVNTVVNLEDLPSCLAALGGTAPDEVYHLASDMGGMGFIEHFRTECMLNVLPDANMLRAAAAAGAGRFFYASTACVYRAGCQDTASPRGLREDRDVYPAEPEDGYGWEKLFAERLCRHFSEERGLVTRVARYHTVYGEHGTWDGGREKVPAAVCRKVAAAVRDGTGQISIWGDGEQVRSFLHVSDAVSATIALMRSGCGDPVNIGSDIPVTVNDLVTVAEDIAGVRLERVYEPGPLGVRGRCSDNAKAREVLGFVPRVSLREGMERTYRWVAAQAAVSV